MSAIAASTAASSAAVALDDLVDEPDPLRPHARRTGGRRGTGHGRGISPIFAITNGEMTAGRIPSRVSVNPNRAPDSAITRSPTAHRPIPPPSAAPWTRAMTGTGQVSMASNMSAIAIASCSLPSTSSAIAARIQSMSAPAQNVWPVAGEHDGAELGRRLLARAARTSSGARAISAASKALWTSGRASVTRATTPPGPRRSTRSASAHARHRSGRLPRGPGGVRCGVLLGIDHLVIAVAIRTRPPRPRGAARADARRVAAGTRRGDVEPARLARRHVYRAVGVFDADLAGARGSARPTLRALEPAADRGDRLVRSRRTTRRRRRGDERQGASDLVDPIAGRAAPTGRPGRPLAAGAAAAPRSERPPFLIEHDPSAAEWTPADRAARALGPARLTVLEIAVDDPNRAIQTFLRSVALRFRPSLSGAGARDADIGLQVVRLRPRRAGDQTPPVTVHLAIRDADPSEHDLLGLRWRVRPATRAGA